MGVLKIRDEDGNVRTISTFKGDKGEGVPDGGEAGQVLKKTADGTEWGDIISNSIVFENTDTSGFPNAQSCSISEKGLYEVSVTIKSGDGITEYKARGLVSISVIGDPFVQCVYSVYGCHLEFSANDTDGKKISVWCTDDSVYPYISEVRLLVPYN